MVITRIVPVPKSGCNIISPKAIMVIAKIGKTPLVIDFMVLGLLLIYLLVKIIRANFINSLGCTPSPPMPNQLLEPFLTLPIPGIITNTKRTKQANKIRLDFFK